MAINGRSSRRNELERKLKEHEKATRDRRSRQNREVKKPPSQRSGKDRRIQPGTGPGGNERRSGDDRRIKDRGIIFRVPRLGVWIIYEIFFRATYQEWLESMGPEA